MIVQKLKSTGGVKCPIVEKPAPYFSSDESRLLNYFRKIKNSSSKNAVIQVARLAAKAG